MTIQSLSLVSSGDPKVDYRRIAETINLILQQAQFLNSSAAQTVIAGNNGVYFEPAPLFTQNSYMIGLRCTWQSPAAAMYLKIATLPTSASDTGDSINVTATLNTGWNASGSCKADIVVGNRGGFAYVWRKTGTVSASCAIRCYTESDGSVSVYAYGAAGAYSYAYISITNAGNLYFDQGATTLYPAPPYTGTPTGTLVFDSGNTTTYPPTAP